MRAQNFGTEPCEKRNGLLAYKNECHFMKTVGDDGNAAGAPDIVSSGSNNGMQPNAGYDPATQSWMQNEQPQPQAQQQQLPSREQNGASDIGARGMPHPMLFHTNSNPSRVSPQAGYVEASGSATNAMSVSPHPDTSSDRPTPNSSSASEHRNATSGRTSFEASPIGGGRHLGTQAEMDAATTAFFSDPNQFGMQHPGMGMTPGRSFGMPDTPGNGYNITEGWGVMPGQTTGMTPVAEGVLRHLMDMPPMDAMDLGWDQGA
jgi:hypothetical protein